MAINNLDPGLNKDGSGTSDGKWQCTKDGNTGTTYSGGGDYGICKKHSSGGTNGVSLKHAFAKADQATSPAVDAATAAHVSGRMTSADFTRSEKAVVSSAFAKAHEGAEIIEMCSTKE